MAADNTPIVFVKYPEPGFVKTRLSQEIGKLNAALLYCLFVEAMLKRIKEGRFKRVVFYRPREKEKEMKTWIDHCYCCVAAAGYSCRGSLESR